MLVDKKSTKKLVDGKLNREFAIEKFNICWHMESPIDVDKWKVQRGVSRLENLIESWQPKSLTRIYKMKVQQNLAVEV